MHHGLGVAIPLHRVQMKPRAEPRRLVALRPRQRGQHLSPRGDHRAPHAQRRRRARHADEKQRLCFLVEEAGEPGSIAIEELVSTAWPGLALHRDPGPAEVVQIAIDRPHRDAQLAGQGLGVDPAAHLQRHHDREQPGGAHASTLPETRRARADASSYSGTTWAMGTQMVSPEEPTSSS